VKLHSTVATQSDPVAMASGGTSPVDRLDHPRVGFHLVDVKGFRALLEWIPDFAPRFFHEGEVRYCMEQRSSHEHFAARFGAKQAVAKALGVERWDPLDIEIVGDGEQAKLCLVGGLAKRTAALSVRVTVSFAHMSGVAGAAAIAEPNHPDPGYAAVVGGAHGAIA
jgi:holo-[acyl-carrier protein] synthase